MKKPLLSIPNYHAESCGEPPSLSFRDSVYVGYFENQHGEQWVVAIDRKKNTGKLYGGDTGWDKVVDVAPLKHIGVILNDPEIHWLQACWSAATRGRIHVMDVQITKVLIPLLADQQLPDDFPQSPTHV